MPLPQLQTQSDRTRRLAITIPASATTAGATILSLLLAAGLTTAEQAQMVGVKILGLTQAGGSRAAFDVADEAVAGTFTAASQRVAAAADYIEPAATDYLSAVRAAANATIAAIAVVYLG